MCTRFLSYVFGSCIGSDDSVFDTQGRYTDEDGVTRTYRHHGERYYYPESEGSFDYPPGPVEYHFLDLPKGSYDGSSDSSLDSEQQVLLRRENPKDECRTCKHMGFGIGCRGHTRVLRIAPHSTAAEDMKKSDAASASRTQAASQARRPVSLSRYGTFLLHKRAIEDWATEVFDSAGEDDTPSRSDSDSICSEQADAEVDLASLASRQFLPLNIRFCIDTMVANDYRRQEQLASPKQGSGSAQASLQLDSDVVAPGSQNSVNQERHTDSA